MLGVLEVLVLAVVFGVLGMSLNSFGVLGRVLWGGGFLTVHAWSAQAFVGNNPKRKVHSPHFASVFCWLRRPLLAT